NLQSDHNPVADESANEADGHPFLRVVGSLLGGLIVARLDERIDLRRVDDGHDAERQTAAQRHQYRLYEVIRDVLAAAANVAVIVAPAVVVAAAVRLVAVALPVTGTLVGVAIFGHKRTPLV